MIRVTKDGRIGSDLKARGGTYHQISRIIPKVSFQRILSTHKERFLARR